MFEFIGKLVVLGLGAVGAYHTTKYVARRGTDGVVEDFKGFFNIKDNNETKEKEESSK